jgi:uncharacterized RDD family membrane protein YckC
MTDPSDPTAPPPDEPEEDGLSLHKKPPPDGEPTGGEPPRSYGAPPSQHYGGPPPQYAPPPGQQWGPPPQPPGPQPGFPAVPPPSGGGPAGGYYHDNASGLYLPAGVELASVGRRIGAYFLAIPLAIVTLGIGYVIWGLVLWPRGTTPALKVLGMKVYRIDNGTVPGFWRMALREIIGRFCDGVLSVITLLISLILFASGAKRQSLHDLVASTTVLYDPNKVLGG